MIFCWHKEKLKKILSIPNTNTHLSQAILIIPQHQIKQTHYYYITFSKFHPKFSFVPPLSLSQLTYPISFLLPTAYFAPQCPKWNEWSCAEFYNHTEHQGMLTALAFLLLTLTPALTSHSSGSPNQYSLSPSLPPTAFIGQYYTCNFRVSGLSAPSFSFLNLPDSFTPTPAGALEGIPSETGSFSITVQYQQGRIRGQQVVILRVAEPNYNATLGKTLNKPANSLNWIQLAVPNTYRVGDRVSLKLNDKTGKNKYRWSYLQLPEMLAGDIDGNLQGVFYNEGYYSFGATCSDQSGNSLDYFFTINVQPLPTSIRTVLVQVPNRNVFKYRFDQLQALQQAATINLVKAQRVAKEASEQFGKVKGFVATSQSNIEMAQKQVAIVEKLAKIALDRKGKEFNRVNQLETALDYAQNRKDIRKSAYDQAVKNTGVFQGLYDAALSLFNKMNDLLSLANQQFIQAQNESIQAAADLSQSQKNVKAATQDVNSAFRQVSESKKVLQAYSNNLSKISFDVNSAFDGRDIANFQNDAAQSAYNTANSNLNKSLQDLQSSKSSVYQLQAQSATAKIHLGQAQFNLRQAMNQLFVAQAAKEQSDKAMLLASAQSSILPSGTTTYIFSGCDIGNYPVISGTASITGSSATGFELSSGYNILYGNCTEAGEVSLKEVKEGDTVVFHGYLKDGFIQGVRIAKQ